jgi:hypothetical protein
VPLIAPLFAPLIAPLIARSRRPPSPHSGKTLAYLIAF